MDISVIIVNWRSAEFLRKCLESVYRDTRELEFEIIVVDNASFDGCGAMLEREFPSVRFIQSADNLGFGAANNLAVEQARGEAVLFLNPDTEVRGAALAKLWQALQSRTDAGAVGARLLNSDLSLQTSCVQPFPRLLNQLLDFDYLHRKLPRASLWKTEALRECAEGMPAVECVSGACLMVRRQALQQIGGGFHPLYFMYTEDLDLCRRLAAAGWKVYFVGSAEVVHHGGGSSGAGQSNFSAVMMRESIFRYMRAWHGNVYALAYRIAMGVVAAVRLLLAGLWQATARTESRRRQLQGSRRKWSYILRWACGLERWSSRTHSPRPDYRLVRNADYKTTA